MRVIKKPYKVLIVDDEELYTELLKNYLQEIEKDSFAISTATKPEDALSLLKSETFDILITDLLMPRISGEDLVKEAKDSSKGTQVIVVSGADALHKAVGTFALGASSFIRKPFTRDEIEKALNLVLKQISHWEELFDQILTKKLPKKN